MDVIEGQVVEGLAACQDRIAGLVALPDGWHDGAGKSPTQAAARTASRLLSCKPGTAASYRIFPTDAGGLLFEFVRCNWDYSVEIGPDGALEICGTETAGDAAVETPPLDVDSDEFQALFNRITGGGR